jgi:hypothetical protein
VRLGFPYCSTVYRGLGPLNDTHSLQSAKSNISGLGSPRYLRPGFSHSKHAEQIV